MALKIERFSKLLVSFAFTSSSRVLIDLKLLAAYLEIVIFSFKRALISLAKPYVDKLSARLAVADISKIVSGSP